MKLIVGLGNPGAQYASTRHNVGFRVVERLATKHGWSWNERRSKAVLASGTLGGEKIVLVKPQTYMNLSGEAVGELLRWYKLPLDDLLVVYDEMDLPPGQLRLRGKGSAAGHNGMKNLLLHLHSDEFARLRVGVGRPVHKRGETIDHVLGAPDRDERISLEQAETRALEAVESFIERGLETTMNLVNVDPEAERRAAEKREQQQARRLPIQIGMNARIFPSNWRPAREEIVFARANGFQSLQFRGPEDGLDAELLGDPLESVAAALRSSRVSASMEIVLAINEQGTTPRGHSLLDALQANLPAISTLPCKYVHLHLVPASGLAREKLGALEIALVPQFRQAVAFAVHHRFPLAFEHNEPGIGLFSRSRSCAALLEAVHELGFVWDFNHTAPEDLQNFLELAPHMTLLHVADTPLPTLNAHLPLGMGSLDIHGYCAALLRRGFHGPAILEIGGVPQSGGFGRDTDEALIDSCRRLRQVVVASMKQVS
jgi:aminoacyl-tRNA hydrolase